MALYLSLVVPQLGRPLIYDEVDFARAASSLAAPDRGPGPGPLRYDRGYIADYPAAPDAGQRYQLALWHPPGYLLLLGLWQRAFPSGGDSSLRLFGALCGLGTLLLTAALGRLAGGPLGAGLAGPPLGHLPLRHPERPPAGRRRHGAPPRPGPLRLAGPAPRTGALDLAGLERGLRPQPELQAGARPGPGRPAHCLAGGAAGGGLGAGGLKPAGRAGRR